VYLWLAAAAAFLLSGNAYGQKKLTLEEIWSGKFRTKRFGDYKLTGDHHLVKGEFVHGTYFINLYNLDGWKKERTLFSTAAHPGFAYIWDFEVSPGLKYLLLAADIRPGFRHSFAARYYLYDIERDTLMPAVPDYIQIPSFTPGGDTLVYFKKNNLYFKPLPDGPETAVTTDGEKNRIINGKTDWVYEEEFGFVKAYAVSPGGRYLAYLRFDESRVPEYTLIFYGDEAYPQTFTYKYPKAGYPNSKVTLHVYDFKNKSAREVELDTFEYKPYIQPGRLPSEFLVMTLNRLQNRLHLYAVDGSGKAELMAEQSDEKYVDLERIKTIRWIDDNRFLWLSERNGYNHIYLYHRRGGEPRQITRGKDEVTSFYGYDPASKKVFFQKSSLRGFNRTVAAQGLKSKKYTLLSPGEGWHSAGFSRDFRFMWLTSSSLEQPPVTVLYRLNRKRTFAYPGDTLADNSGLKALLDEYIPVEKKYITLPSADKRYRLNAVVYRPPQADSLKPYGLLVYQYNGPGIQTAVNRWGGYNDLFHRMLAQEGIMVLTVDTRGTGGRGKEFRQITYKHLGKYETEDLRAAVAEMQKCKDLAPGRTGIWGWSYGGYMAALAVHKAADVFDMAVAVAPVTDWRFYDTAYTERYMQRPEDNPDGYQEASVLSYAEGLEKPLFLIHGTADDNVHVQNTYALARKLQESGIPFDMHIYPDKNHGIYGGQTRLHLYRLMHEYFLKHLKN